MNDELICFAFCIQFRQLYAPCPRSLPYALCPMRHAPCALPYAPCALLYAIIHQASPDAIMARALTTLAATLEPPLRPTLDIQG